VVKTWKQALLVTLAPMSISLIHPFRYTFPSLGLFLVLVLGALLLSLSRYPCALGFLLTPHKTVFLNTTPPPWHQVFLNTFQISLPTVSDVAIFLTIKIKS